MTPSLKLLKLHSSNRLVSLSFVTGKYGLSYPYSGIRLLLVDNNKKAYLHNITRYDFDKNISRFEPGSIDNIKLNIPLSNEITKLWIAPETGTWMLSEVILQDDYGEERFVCGKLIGNDGDPAVILNHHTESSFDVVKYDQGIHSYNVLKSELLQWNVKLIVGGLFITIIYKLSFDTIEAFVSGGLVGLIYLFLLEKQTDCIGSMDKLFIMPLVSSPLRLSLVYYLSYLYISNNNTFFFPYVIGFLMYKLAVVVYSFKKIV